MELREDIVTLYEHLSRKIDNRPHWKFLPTDKQNAMIDNFIDRLASEYRLKSIGKHFLLDYFSYQYLRWFEKNDTQFGKTVMLNWLIGPKAIERWNLRSEGSSFIVRQKILIPYSIHLEAIFPIKNTRHDALALFPNEEAIKERFKLDEARIGYCVENTTLFNKRSKWCLTCKSRTTCKNLLKKMYPSLYLQRGYAAKN
jgi:hypothetical protein